MMPTMTRTCVEIVVDPVKDDISSELKILVEEIPKTFPVQKI